MTQLGRVADGGRGRTGEAALRVCVCNCAYIVQLCECMFGHAFVRIMWPCISLVSLSPKKDSDSCSMYDTDLMFFSVFNMNCNKLRGVAFFQILMQTTWVCGDPETCGELAVYI